MITFLMLFPSYTVFVFVWITTLLSNWIFGTDLVVWCLFATCSCFQVLLTFLFYFEAQPLNCLPAHECLPVHVVSGCEIVPVFPSPGPVHLTSCFFLPRDAELREPVPLEYWKTKQKLFNCETIFVEPFKKNKGSGLSHLWQRSSNVSLNPKLIVKKLQWWKSVTGMSGSMNTRWSCSHPTWTLWPLTDHYYWKTTDSSASQQTLTRLA